jgi:prolactin regulatory element-binding protein
MISCYDFSSRAPSVEALAELEVSKDDSVTCLTNLATKDGLVVFAGNGSCVEDKIQGKDMSFKAFEVQFSKVATARLGEEKLGKISFLSKTQILTTPKAESARKEAYIRLMRLSPPQRTASSIPNKRIGAVASGLAGIENEIVVFSATSNRPQAEDIIRRIKLSEEANDLDIWDGGEGQFQVAYVQDSSVHIQDVNYDFAQRKNRIEKEHQKVYTVPHPDASERKGKSKLRGIRWLSPKHLLLLSNKPNRSGVELSVLHLYEEGPGSIVSRKTLPSHVKAATDFDVALLDSDTDGAYQIAVAVGAIDTSLSLFTIDYHGPARDSLTQLHKFDTYYEVSANNDIYLDSTNLDQVHSLQITKALFAYLPDKTTGPQYLRLATTSIGNTISVETFELVEEKSRHVLQTANSRLMYTTATYVAIAMVVLAVSLMIQSLLDPAGTLTRGMIPANLQNIAGRTFGEGHRAKRHAAVLNNADSPAIQVERRIRDLLHLHNPPMGSSASQTEKALVIHHDSESDGKLSTEVHEGHEAMLKKHTEAKRWDELSKEDQVLWKKKLSDAGMWAVDEGETILKSIFFGQIGGLVGQVAQGVLA